MNVRLDNVAFLYDLPYAPLETVIAEFRSMRPLGDGDQLIARVPFKSTGTVGGEIAVRVVTEGFRRPDVLYFVVVTRNV